GIQNTQCDQIDAGNLDFEEASFDSVVCSSVLEYVPDDFGLMRKLVKSLKTAGHLIVSIPHAHSLLGKIEDILRFTRLHLKFGGGRHLAVTLHRYRRSSFVEQLARLGLDTLTCTTFEFPFGGSTGIAISRFKLFGAMLLVVGRKRESRNISRVTRFSKM